MVCFIEVICGVGLIVVVLFIVVGWTGWLSALRC